MPCRCMIPDSPGGNVAVLRSSMERAACGGIFAMARPGGKNAPPLEGGGALAQYRILSCPLFNHQALWAALSCAFNLFSFALKALVDLPFLALLLILLEVFFTSLVSLAIKARSLGFPA